MDNQEKPYQKLPFVISAVSAMVVTGVSPGTGGVTPFIAARLITAFAVVIAVPDDGAARAPRHQPRAHDLRHHPAPR